MLCACAIAGSASPTDAVASNRVQAMCRMLIPDMSDLLDEHDEARTEPQPRCGAGRPADHDLNSWPRTDRCNAMPSPGARSEERRGGKEWVSTCRSRGSPYH